MKVLELEAKDGDEMSSEYQMAVAMRILWHLIEKAGGTIVIDQDQLTSLVGAFTVLVSQGKVTLSVERELGDSRYIQ